jgi:hypothetical protein
MIAYPQLANGAVSQYPLRKTRRQRTVVNRAADGSSIRLADPTAEVGEWLLRYAELSDDELAALQQFFISAGGSLNGFTFLDPSANLLAWSEDLTNAVWQKGPFLSATAGTGFWNLSNAGGGPQALSQTISGPGDYLYCFSVYARSAAQLQVTMILGTTRSTQSVSDNWSRLVLSGKGEAGAESVNFGLEITAGSSLDIRGLQVEAQPGASVYKISNNGGVYEDARFGDDALTVVTTGPNRHSCTVKIIHANHL